MKRVGLLTGWLLLAGMLISHGAFAEENSDGKVFDLGEVVISEEKTTNNEATTVTEVSAEEIKAKGAQNVADALKFLPGVQVQTSGKNQMFVSVRGFEQDQVKVLIDGVPARENYFGSVDLSMLPAESISKITVIKGASSVLYGSNTLGGVINIITKKGKGEPQTSMTAAYGDYGTAHYSASNGAQVGKFNYWLSGGYQTSNGYSLSDSFDKHDKLMGLGTPYNEDGGARDLSDYDKKSFDGKVGYDVDATRLYLSFNYADDERGCPTSASRYWAFTDWRQWQLNLVGEHEFNDDFTLKSRLYYVKHDDSLEDVSWDAAHKTADKKKWFENSYYDDYSIGGEVQAQMHFGEINTVRLGVNDLEDNHKEADYYDSIAAKANKGTVGWQREEEYTGRTYSVALEDEIKVTKPFSVVAGVSYDVFEPTKTDNQPEPDKTDSVDPQIGLVYALNDCTKLHASAGHKIRFPAFKELYSKHAGGNPDLEAEEANEYEVGSTHLLSDAFTLDTSVFYYDMTNMISTAKDTSGNTYYINVDDATIYGAELALVAQLSSACDAGINYTYMTTVDESQHDRDLSGRPRHRINMNATYRFPFGLTADAQGGYVMRQYWENNSKVWSDIPDYFVMNAKLTQKLKKVGIVLPEIFVEGSNVLDEDYYETAGPEPGLNFLAGITLKM